MVYVVIGKDGRDAGALARRMAARPAHLEGFERMRLAGQARSAMALLDEAGTMIGSVCIMDFADEAALRAWLDAEPYVTGDVWRSVEVHPARLAPGFA